MFYSFKKKGNPQHTFMLVFAMGLNEAAGIPLFFANPVPRPVSGSLRDPSYDLSSRGIFLRFSESMTLFRLYPMRVTRKAEPKVVCAPDGAVSKFA